MRKIMYRMEFELNEEAIIRDGKYDLKTIYNTIDGLFKKEECYLLSHEGNNYVYAINRGSDKDMAAIMLVALELSEKPWFCSYVMKFIYSDDEYAENNFDYEDVIQEMDIDAPYKVAV